MRIAKPFSFWGRTQAHVIVQTMYSRTFWLDNLMSPAPTSSLLS